MGLSSNVMNMKFMQKAQDKKKEEEVKSEGKKVKDTSEWRLPAAAIRPHVKPAVTIKTVGYGSIASMTADDEESDNESNHTSGLKPTFLPEKNEKSKKDDAEKFLSGILDKAHKSKDKKRPSKDSKHSRKKARTSLS